MSTRKGGHITTIKLTAEEDEQASRCTKEGYTLIEMFRYGLRKALDQIERGEAEDGQS
jgi:hypothetical protein